MNQYRMIEISENEIQVQVLRDGTWHDITTDASDRTQECHHYPPEFMYYRYMKLKETGVSEWEADPLVFVAEI